METKPTNKQKTNKNKTKNKKSPQNQFFVKSILEHFQNTCFDTLKINNYYIIILKKTLHWSALDENTTCLFYTRQMYDFYRWYST